MHLLRRSAMTYVIGYDDDEAAALERGSQRESGAGKLPRLQDHTSVSSVGEGQRSVTS